MRACMLVYSFYESDNRVRRYAEALAQRGDHVDVVALQRGTFPERETLAGVNVFRIQRRPLNEKRKLDYLLRLGLFFFRSFIFATTRHFRSRYDVFHVHSVPDFQVFATAVAKLLGAKVILDIHDIVPELFCSKFGVSSDSPLFRLLLLVERLSASYADHVIIANHLWHERITARSVQSAKCSVVMNYPDPALFARSASAAPGRSQRFQLLYPGTLSRHQGIGCAIEAVALLRDRIPDLHFLVYGKGTDEGYFRGLVDKRDVGTIVEFGGSLPMEKVAEKMRQADLGIEPKSSQGFGDEAFSTKILEFMLAGVPVIASATSIHQRYISDKLVRYFRADDPEDLASAIEELYRDPALRTEYVRSSSEFVKEYTWDRRRSEYFTLVDSLVQKPAVAKESRSL